MKCRYLRIPLLLLLQHVENTLSLVENYMENVAATVEQNNDIQTYLRNPDTKNKTRASVRLNNFTSYMGMIRGIAIIGQNAPAIDSMTNIVQKTRMCWIRRIFLI